MIIPKTIKVGAHIYKIIIDNKSGKLCGQTDREKGTITLNGNLMQTEKETTLFYEVLHIINCELSETDIDFFANAIYAFLKDNKFIK